MLRLCSKRVQLTLLRLSKIAFVVARTIPRNPLQLALPHNSSPQIGFTPDAILSSLLSYDEARCIAANIAKLPDLITRPTGATNAAMLAICERVAEVQALLDDHVRGGKHTAAEVVAKAQAVLSERQLLRAMLDVGYFLPNTPPVETTPRVHLKAMRQP
jgi:hypothetical protein